MSRRPRSGFFRIIMHRKALCTLAVNPLRHYVSCRRAAFAPGMMTQTSDPETTFLEQLGQRVRTMRALRGMSRKVLAKVSGISERYIAQLEAGRGNVSIVLLRRVSNAMGAHLEDLIPAAEPSPDWAVIRDLLRKASPAQVAQAKDVLAGQNASTQRLKSFAGIALIGLRGAGKSRSANCWRKRSAGISSNSTRRSRRKMASRSPRSSRFTARKAFAGWNRRR